VAAATLLVFLFRPRTASQVARGIGQVVAELKKGKRETESSRGEDELLVETAEKLGIRTEGRTHSEIRDEILAKAGQV
jgi:hypothetical protein